MHTRVGSPAPGVWTKKFFLKGWWWGPPRVIKFQCLNKLPSSDLQPLSSSSDALPYLPTCHAPSALDFPSQFLPMFPIMPIA
jgi:hypothetical protein